MSIVALNMLHTARCNAFHELDPRARIVATILFAVIVSAIEGFIQLGMAILIAMTATVAARLPLSLVGRRLLALEGFMAVLLITLPFTAPGQALFSIGPLSASKEGLLLAAAIAIKANAVVMMILAQLGTLEPVSLGHALGRLGVPQRLVVMLLFTVRYVSVFETEYRRLRQAMQARAFRLRASRHTWRSLGWLVGMLLVRANERATRVLHAMKCRGFSGHFPVLDDLRFSRSDAVYICAFAALALGLLLWDRL